jgi:hypothetical protein
MIKVNIDGICTYVLHSFQTENDDVGQAQQQQQQSVKYLQL